MGWDEALYAKAEGWISRVGARRRRAVAGPASVSLDDVRQTLEVWSALLSGRNWIIQESEDWPASDGERLYLPPFLEIFADRGLNRIAYLYVCSNLVGKSERHFPELRRWRDQFKLAMVGRPPELSSFETDCLHDGAHPRISSSPDASSVAPFRRVANLFVVQELRATGVARVATGEGGKRSGKSTDLKKKAVNKVELIEGAEQTDHENPLVHSFEKVHTTDDYTGGRKHQDAEDELEDHADSLEGLELRQMIRSSQATSATLKGDFAMDIDVSESETFALATANYRYREWNYKEGKYLADWCQLTEQGPSSTSLQEELAAGKQLTERKKKTRKFSEILRKQFLTLLKDPTYRSNRSDGSELHLESLVDLMSTPIELRESAPRIYLNTRKSIREVSVVILFDCSLSSDSWIDDKRIMDLTKDALVTVGESLRAVPISVQLMGFSSHTRNKVTCTMVKPFDGAWTQGLRRLMSIEPAGYTRIGPALRHCSAILEKRKSRFKWIILISDGKPTDLDRYEGRYGVQDVKQAVREASQAGIGIRCISIEKRHRSELAEMFGIRGYELLSMPDQLPLRVASILKDLSKRTRS